MDGLQVPAGHLGMRTNAPRLGLLRIVRKVSSNCSKRGLQMIVGRCGVRRKHRLRSFKDHTSSPPLRSNRLELAPLEFCSLVLRASLLKFIKPGFGGGMGDKMGYKVSCI